MKIYRLTISENYEDDNLITISRDSIFNKIDAIYYKIMNDDLRVYLSIWEDEQLIGDHDVTLLIYENLQSENSIPSGCLINNILDNNLEFRFTARM